MDETMQPGPPHICPWVKFAERAEEEMGSPGTARIEEVLSLLRSIQEKLSTMESKVVRIETLVDVDLSRGGTLDKLEQKVDGMNTKILLFSGATTAVFNALRFLPALFK